MGITELDKTVLLSILVFTKGSLTSFITEQQLTKKFAMRKRILVRSAIKDLVKNKLLIIHSKEKKYKLTKKGLETASKVLHQGAKLWYMK
jgi:predicted transcriptional regulator